MHARGELAAGARAALAVRAASRLVLELADDLVDEPTRLRAALAALDWPRWLGDATTWAAHVSGTSARLRHPGFAARVVAEAVAARFGRAGRPAPDRASPAAAAVLVDVRVARSGTVAVGLDLGGRSLHRRAGPRAGAAPLREDVAAGLALLAGVEAGTPVIDPFCGSATLLFEAATLALGRPPHRAPEALALARLPGFRDLPLAGLAPRPTPPSAPPMLLGADTDAGALAAARRTLAQAGLAGRVDLRHSGADALIVPDGAAAPGVLLTNPPWGRRLDRPAAERAWHALGTLARRLPGWTLAVLSGDPSLTRALGLRAERKHPVLIAGVDCRLLVYKIHPA